MSVPFPSVKNVLENDLCQVKCIPLLGHHSIRLNFHPHYSRVDVGGDDKKEADGIPDESDGIKFPVPSLDCDTVVYF